MNETSLFLIYKGWIDPLENRNASGYKPWRIAKMKKMQNHFVTMLVIGQKLIVGK